MDYALVKEKSVTFAVVVVKSHILSDPSARNSTRSSFKGHFPGVPIVLMAQTARGVPKYFGRDDIVKFLSKIDYRRLPWKRKTV